MFVEFDETDPKKTIVINRFDSYCRNCGQSAIISDGYHHTVYGYNRDQNGMPGCGVEWEYIDTNYTGLSHLLEKRYPEYKIVKREL